MTGDKSGTTIVDWKVLVRPQRLPRLAMQTSEGQTASAKSNNKRKHGRAGEAKNVKKTKDQDRKDKIPTSSKVAETSSNNKEKKTRLSAAPTWFLGIQVSDPEVHSGVREAQRIIAELCPQLKESAVNVSKVNFQSVLMHFAELVAIYENCSFVRPEKSPSSLRGGSEVKK